jgi:hypothetical protein
MKHILVINYTQSGQLTNILNRFNSPFENSNDFEVEHVEVSPKEPFPFPWTGDAFWGAMPGCVLEEGLELNEFSFKREKYDLIVFGYQVWFLSVSLPSMAVLQHPKFKDVINETPVVTVIGARNMWLSAHESVKQHITNAGGKFVANIPFIDRHNNLASVVTIFYWMLTGKKDRMWGIFPIPGVHPEDIEKANEPGKLTLQAIEKNEFNSLQKDIHELGHIHLASSVMFMELRAKMVFKIWAKLVRRKGTTPEKERFWLNVFKYYLLIAIFVLSPIVLTIYFVLVYPFVFKSVSRKKAYFCGLIEEV